MRHAFSVWMESGEFPYGDYNITDDLPLYIDHPQSGRLTVNVGDYVIKGTNEGDFYPYSAEVFDQTYVKTPSNFRERVQREADELQQRHSALTVFLGSAVYRDLDQEHRDLIKSQHTTMSTLLTILNRRLELLS